MIVLFPLPLGAENITIFMAVAVCGAWAVGMVLDYFLRCRIITLR